MATSERALRLKRELDEVAQQLSGKYAFDDATVLSIIDAVLKAQRLVGISKRLAEANNEALRAEMGLEEARGKPKWQHQDAAVRYADALARAHRLSNKYWVAAAEIEQSALFDMPEWEQELLTAGNG